MRTYRDTALGEVWMQVRDHRKLARLALIQDASHRDIARAVFGSNAHSYISRIFRGEVRTMDPEAAVRMCHFFGVAVDDFFVTKSSSISGSNVQDERRKRKADAA